MKEKDSLELVALCDNILNDSRLIHKHAVVLSMVMNYLVYKTEGDENVFEERHRTLKEEEKNG